MSQSTRLQAPLLIGFVLLLAVAAGSIWLYFVASQLNAEVSRSLQTRSVANRLLILTQDAETGQRGFLLTHNRDYLAPYSGASAAIPQTLTDLANAVSSDATEAAIVAELKDLIHAKLRELASTLKPADKGDFSASLAIVNNNTGNSFMRDIRMKVDQLRQEEDKARDVATAWASRANILLAVSTTLAVIAIVVLAIYTVKSSNSATKNLLTAQQNLEDVNRNLEGIVEARVGDLRTANEEIQRFAYIVSHDLRAPLVNVLGFTSELDALRSELADFLAEADHAAPHIVTSDRRAMIEHDFPEALGFIRSSTTKMDSLINAILKLSREGRRKLSPETIDIAALVAAQAGSLAQQLDKRDAVVQIEGKLPDMVSDRLALEQIFGNLIENAVKYLSPHRPGRITVRGRRDGRVLRYEIVDNGRGIEKRDLERIFELFRRAGDQDTPGEGIGLAYVRNLTRRLGGDVTVRSMVGEGSTFTLVLPPTLRVEAERKAA